MKIDIKPWKSIEEALGRGPFVDKSKRLRSGAYLMALLCECSMPELSKIVELGKEGRIKMDYIYDSKGAYTFR